MTFEKAIYDAAFLGIGATAFGIPFFLVQDKLTVAKFLLMIPCFWAAFTIGFGSLIYFTTAN